MDVPAISIVIPVFNREKLLPQTLESLCNQNFSGWECLLVDDGSTDTTPEVAHSFCNRDSRFRFFHRPSDRPKGANACRNFGLEMSLGEFVVFLDSDDVFGEDYLRAHLSFHQKENVDASIAQGKVFQGDVSNIVRNWSEIHPEKDVISELIEGSVAWQTASIVWRKSCLRSRPFRESLSSSQEWTFHIEQAINGLNFGYVDEVVFIRDHEDRIGKDVSEKKCRSTFLSRKIIWEVLEENKEMTAERESGLLKFILSALRQSLEKQFKSTTREIVKFLWNRLSSLRHRWTVLRILIFAVPVFSMTGKGYNMFRIGRS